MSDYTGLKLGNYRIVCLLGQGGFAHVYLGEHVYLKTPAAIKVLNMQLANDALESFLKEARTICRKRDTTAALSAKKSLAMGKDRLLYEADRRCSTIRARSGGSSS